MFKHVWNVWNMFKRRQRHWRWRRFGVFIVNFEHISRLVLVFLLLTLCRYMLAGKEFRTMIHTHLFSKHWLPNCYYFVKFCPDISTSSFRFCESMTTMVEEPCKQDPIHLHLVTWKGNILLLLSQLNPYFIFKIR